ncbi:sugar transferase [Candidatus Wolfebacteria bacterium]|nr:sugar transferase [Candidatus Wolfebacteria bacterium]
MVKFKTIILILGDVFLLYASLILALIFRYGFANLKSSFSTHLGQFSLIFIVWIIIFYLADLYQLRTLKRGIRLMRILIISVILGVAVSIIFFYLFSDFFKLTPKTNLAIFSVIFGILDFVFRLLIIKSGYARTKIAAIGDSPAIKEIISYLKSNPQIGYELSFLTKENLNKENLKKLEHLATAQKLDAILIPPHLLKQDADMIKFIYRLLPLKIEIFDSLNFYEMIFQKAPLEEIKEGWFIEKITTRRNAYDFAKRILDIFLSFILGIILLPLMAIIAIAVKLNSKGPAIFKHKRAGLNNKPFILSKFRIMVVEHSGLPWTLKDDDRLTFVGKILHYTHLNEIPQLWNILKGDISFIGPRPESVELAEKFAKLPYYEMRHIIKPGLTGWAQVNFRPSASMEEAKEKLSYDIYYVKNRSFILDFLILLKTIRHLFLGQK